MGRYKWLLAPLLFLAFAGAAPLQYKYEGTWQAHNRPIDGPMSCTATYVAKDRWQGRFYGVWQGVEFDYTVEFAGPIDGLKGEALIDGASYLWAGNIGARHFDGNFTGSRYDGTFRLKRIK